MRCSQSWFVTLGLMWLCSGCGVECDHPAALKEQRVAEPRLSAGPWYDPTESSDESAAFRVSPVEGEPGRYKVTSVAIDSRPVHSVTLLMECSRVNDRLILSFCSIGPEGEPEGVWSIAECEFVADDHIKVRVLNKTRVAADIQAGRVAGKVTSTRGLFGKRGQHVRLTAESDALRAYLAEHGRQVFESDSIVLNRLD